MHNTGEAVKLGTACNATISQIQPMSLGRFFVEIVRFCRALIATTERVVTIAGRFNFE